MAALANFAKVSGAAVDAVGPVKFDVITFTGATYATVAPTTGNTGLKAGLQGLTKDGRAPIAVIQVGSAGDYALSYTPADDKLKVVVASTGVEVANATDLSSKTFTVLCISK